MSSSQVNFTTMQSAKEYFSSEDLSIEQVGLGLEDLIEMRSKRELTDAEFLELNATRLIKTVSQAAKTARLYQDNLDQVIRPLRKAIKEETKKAEAALLEKKEIDEPPTYLQNHLVEEKHQTIGKLARILEDILPIFLNKRLSPEAFLLLNLEEHGKKLSQTAKKKGIYQGELKEMIQTLRENIRGATELARKSLWEEKDVFFENEEYKQQELGLQQQGLKDAREAERNAQSSKKGESSSSASPEAESRSIERMGKNFQKALEEHRAQGKDPLEQQSFVEALNAPIDFAEKTPLECEWGVCEKQGRRSSMEDAHFYKALSCGILMGVLDGHGGAEVSKHGAERLPDLFQQTFNETNGDVYKTFNQLFEKIESEIEARSDWDKAGSTAVVSFIDPKTHCIYTATLGDSEANIYRVINGQWKSIPLSCVRDWSSKSDRKRAKKIASTNKDFDKKKFNKAIDDALRKYDGDSKVLRFPSILANLPTYNGGGVNVSRSIGDAKIEKEKRDWGIDSEKPSLKGISTKPKITLCQLKPEDLIILACDGLKDYVKENKIISKLPPPCQPQNVEAPSTESIAKSLTEEALQSQLQQAKSIHDRGDNVTVLAARALLPKTS